MADDKYLRDKLDALVEKAHDIDSSLKSHVATFEAHTKQDEKVFDELKRNTDILAVNTESLKSHMRRTDQLEEYVKRVESRLTPLEVEALRKEAVRQWWHDKVFLFAKLGGAGAALGAVGAALKILLHLWLK